MNTETSYTIPVAALRAVLLAAASKDVRYYLKGVLIEPRADTLAIVATDDNRLHCVVLDKPGTVAGAAFIVPRELAAAIVKGAKKGADVTIVTSAPYVGSVYLELRRDDGIAARGLAVDGRFPDWRRIVPSVGSAGDVSPGQFNYVYLADAQAAAAALLETRHAIINVVHRGDNAALVTCPDLSSFFAVVMPIRADRATPGGHAATAYATLTLQELPE